MVISYTEFMKITDLDVEKEQEKEYSIFELLLLKERWECVGMKNGWRIWRKGKCRIGINDGKIEITGDIEWLKDFKPHIPIVNAKGSKKWVGLIAR